MKINDPYFKKTISYSFKDIDFNFHVANTLFSTFELDKGTDILIRSIETHNPRTILDIGCGYGPLGIMLAKTNPKSVVTMLDSNLLAIRYTNYNIVANNVLNAEAIGSVGMESVANTKYDLIVSNIPAKIGDEAIAIDFIFAPHKQLNPEGELWVVVVSALNRLIPALGSKYNLKVKKIRKRHGHTVYKIKK